MRREAALAAQKVTAKLVRRLEALGHDVALTPKPVPKAAAAEAPAMEAA